MFTLQLFFRYVSRSMNNDMRNLLVSIIFSVFLLFSDSEVELRLTFLVLRERYHKERRTWQKVKNFFSRLFKRYDGVPLVDVNSVTVFLGVHDYKRPSLATKGLRVTAMVAGEFDSEDVTEDIALIKLEKEVPYSTVIQGICLPAENEGLPPPESPCLVTGWGRLRSGRYGTKLRQFQTYIVHGKVSNPFFQEKLMICTRSETNNTGARKGDSGGPLVCLRNNTFVIYGVLSFGFEEGCSDLKDRQAFTKVTRYLSWLKKAAAKLHTNMCSDIRDILLPILCAMFLLFNGSEELCGKPFVKPIFSTKDLVQNRISNGIEARMHSHPWQALVHILGPRSYKMCGGSLLHYKQENASDLILTAAHCLVDWERYRKEKTAWEKLKRFLGRLFKRHHSLDTERAGLRVSSITEGLRARGDERRPSLDCRDEDVLSHPFSADLRVTAPITHCPDRFSEVFLSALEQRALLLHGFHLYQMSALRDTGLASIRVSG
ncbi:hypothetical protein M513_01646 [Trichuris suis]|uniref:Peptidase S1 domain-containing protein n=1 Tax=Trichuris suis TaxID=68888 RepID=A0A085MJZ7_9BILA|nr:hypothetical protein M513_01646 [Trichuris suis]